MHSRHQPLYQKASCYPRLSPKLMVAQIIEVTLFISLHQAMALGYDGNT